MAVSVRASPQGLKLVDRARRLKGWNKQSPAWADLAMVSISTLKRFWVGEPISADSFVSICNAVSLDWYDIAELEGVTPQNSSDYQSLLRVSVLDWNRWKRDNPKPIIDLEDIDLSSVDLRGADLRYVSLKSADLRAAILEDVNLCEADLSHANLSGANLTGADLSQVSALGAIFDGATLTGACIQDWNINADTSLEGVKCDYIFRINKQGRFSGRLPIDANSVFYPGEFTQRFQILASALETIDLTFSSGIDWKAFFMSFQELRSIRPEEKISIQGIERKGEAFIIRLEVASEADKASIETKAKELYIRQINALEAQVESTQKLIEEERREKATLLSIVKTMSESQSGNHRNYFSKDLVKNTQPIPELDQRDLNEAEKEIQALISTLAETYNTTTNAGKEKLMKELGQEVKQHPKWQCALSEGGIELIQALCAPIGIPVEMARVYLEEE